MSTEHTRYNPLAGAGTPAFTDLSENVREQYEASIVNHLLGRYHMPSSVRQELFRQCEIRSGLRRLTLHDFHLKFPSFPIYLRAEVEKDIAPDFTLTRLFRNFCDRKGVKRFLRFAGGEDAAAALEANLPLGLILRWPYMGGAAGIVLHTRHICWDVRGTRIVYVNEDGGQLCLEPLSLLLESIDFEASGRGHLWHPDETETAE